MNSEPFLGGSGRFLRYREPMIAAMALVSVLVMVSGESGAQCPEDLDGDRRVDGPDLAFLLSAWGGCDAPCSADLDGSGVVDGGDLARVLLAWTSSADPDCGGTESEIELFRFDAEEIEVGVFTEAMLDETWGHPPFSNGVREGRVSVVLDSTQGRTLQFLYPEGEYGTSETGAQWKYVFDRGHERVRLRYRIRFDEGFDFVRGGKLPGLIGGAGNTGGGIPTGSDGWSARMMWRAAGRAVQYVYHPDQPDNYGEDMPWMIDDEVVHFESGRWYLIEHEMTMNTPGLRDGVLVCRLDGVEALRREDLRFRDVDAFAIDGLYVSTFFGGSSESWATTRDERIRFDDVEIVAIGVR